MINIDYTITFQDDLDANETSNEYSFNRPWVKWGIFRGLSLIMFLDGLYLVVLGIIESSDPESNLTIGLGLFCIVVGIIFPLLMRPKIAQYFWARRYLKIQSKKQFSQEKIRNIYISETELIFKTEYSETAWTWKAVAKFFEGNKGFIIWFYSGHTKYIPKKIWSDIEGVKQFTNILEKHS